MAYKFNVDDVNLYPYNDLRERTKQRLIQIAECGMELVGDGQFGIEGVVSGLYIEMVLNYSDKHFNDYIQWAKGIINQDHLKAV